MERLVEHILYIGDKERENITPLQLSLVAYFAFGYLINAGHKEVLEELYLLERFEGRANGPSLPETFKKYNQYNSLPILEEGTEDVELSNIEDFNQAILNLIRQDVFDLVKVSQKHSFWQYNKVYILSGIRVSYDMCSLVQIFEKETNKITIKS